MIGATFKLGFEDSAVRRGMRGLGGLMGRVGRQVGIGMAREVGSRMTDLLGRIVMAAPDTLLETMNWAGGLTDMSTQTGVAVKDLILLEEKLRLAGVQAKDTSRIVSSLGDSIFEATRMDSPDITKIEGFGLLGINPEDLDDKNVMEVFDLITRRIKELGPDAKQLETAMGDIFGAKIGYQLLRYAKDYDAITQQAINNVGDLSTAVNESAPDMDRFADALGRFENFKKSLASIALEEFFKIAGADSADKFFDEFDPEKLRPYLAKAGEMLKGFFDNVASGNFKIGDALSGFMEKIGESIGTGIKKSFGVGDGGFGIGQLLGISGPSSGSKADPQMDRNNNLLERIERKLNPFATFSR